MSEPDPGFSEAAEEKLAGELTVDAWLDTDPPPVATGAEADSERAGAAPDPAARSGLWDRLGAPSARAPSSPQRPGRPRYAQSVKTRWSRLALVTLAATASAFGGVAAAASPPPNERAPVQQLLHRTPTPEAERSAGKPVLGRTAIVTAVRGPVSVRLAASSGFMPLTASIAVPFGSVVDAVGSAGRLPPVVRITTATTSGGRTTSGLFYGGRFKLGQSSSGNTTLTLNPPLNCPSTAMRALGAIAAGHFTTRGRSAAASNAGTSGLTHWLTEDSCSATRIVVAIHGSVRVDDFVKRRFVVIRAPGGYSAGA
ncbi:MAG TPA: hypothetical protein VID68_11355 [Solirubrobacteraceae bacterium]|jgi:hypothetical protein